MKQSITLISAAVLQQGDNVLLVLQQGKNDLEALWALPGGRLELGETFIEGLQRELFEETGLTIEAPDRLLCASHIQTAYGIVIAKTFLVTRWKGSVLINDPDELIKDVQFFSLSEACTHLRRHTWAPMWEPGVRYLESGDSGKLWTYRENESGKLTLDSVI